MRADGPSLFILELTEFDVRSPREEPRAEITAEGPEQVCLRQSQQSDSTEAQPSHKAAHVVFTVEEFRETEITQAVRRGEKLQMKYLCEGRKKKKKLRIYLMYIWQNDLSNEKCIFSNVYQNYKRKKLKYLWVDVCKNTGSDYIQL